MNAQANLLKNKGILDITMKEVEEFLVRNSGKKYSSNEIYNNMPGGLKTQIQAIANSYKNGACSSPASYTGVVASMITKTHTDFVHDYHYFCPVLKRYDDAFEKL